jgi:hypothetical protein
MFDNGLGVNLGIWRGWIPLGELLSGKDGCLWFFLFFGRDASAGKKKCNADE